MDRFDENRIAKELYNREENTMNELDRIIRKEAERRQLKLEKGKQK